MKKREKISSLEFVERLIMIASLVRVQGIVTTQETTTLLIRNLSALILTMSDKKSPPLGVFRLNPLRAPPAFQERGCRDVKKTDKDNFNKEKSEVVKNEGFVLDIEGREPVESVPVSTELQENQCIKCLIGKDKGIEEGKIKTTKSHDNSEKKSIHDKKTKMESRKHMTHKARQKSHKNSVTSDAKQTVLPSGLLAEVTQMVKEDKVTVPSVHVDGVNAVNKISKTASSPDFDNVIKCMEETSESKDQPDIDHDLSDSRMKTDGGYKEVIESTDETACSIGSVLTVYEDFTDPFSQLDIEGLVETNTASVEDNEIVATPNDRNPRKRKRERKKAKEKARKERKKKTKATIKDKPSEKEESDENKPSRPVVNYFVAIQITNPKIKAALQRVQDDIVSRCEDLAPAMNKIATLHLTLFVASINTEDELGRSKLALDAAQTILKPLYTLKPLSLNIAGLGHFRHEVLFARVKPENQVEQLQHIAETVEECFLNQEIVSPDSKGFKPHITIAKLSFMRKRKKKGIKKIDGALFEEHIDLEFGNQEASTLQLCAMLKKKDDQGYYHVDHRVQFGPDIAVEDSQNGSIAVETVKILTDNVIMAKDEDMLIKETLEDNNGNSRDIKDDTYNSNNTSTDCETSGWEKISQYTVHEKISQDTVLDEKSQDTVREKISQDTVLDEKSQDTVRKKISQDTVLDRKSQDTVLDEISQDTVHVEISQDTVCEDISRDTLQDKTVCLSNTTISDCDPSICEVLPQEK